jgi:hypothetical protein
MTLYVLVVMFSLASIAGLYFEINSGARKAFKYVQFGCGVIAFGLGFWIFIVANKAQNISEQRQVSGLSDIQKEQRAHSEYINKLRESEVAAAKAQEEAQKKLAEAQNKQLELQNKQNESSEKLNESSQKLIHSQLGAIELLDRLTLNHDLSGIEISFTPSQERWEKIAIAYRKTTAPPEQDVSYVDAAMMAERDGEHWRIVFKPIEVKTKIVKGNKEGGSKSVPKLSTADKNNRAFEDVLREAALGLRIAWGNGTETALEPWSEDYPSAIYVSRNRIALVIRSPLVLWNLNELKDDLKNNHKPTVTFYGRDFPIALPESFTIQSLDPAVLLDQTIQLNWKFRGKSTEHEQKMNRQSSGPHELDIAFKFGGPFSEKPRAQR